MTTKKYYAAPIYNTWAKTGYLFENGWFICEYTRYMKPSLFAKNYSTEELKNQTFNFEGYQPFEDTNEFVDLDFYSYLKELNKKGLINEVLNTTLFAELSKTDQSSTSIEDIPKENNFTYLGVENFRNIENYQHFDFKPITFVTGQNNSGKSSMIKSFLLLSHIEFDKNSSKMVIKNDLEAPLYNLDFRSLINNQNNSSLIKIAININFQFKQYENKPLKAEFIFSVNESNAYLELKMFEINFIESQNNIEYILRLSEKNKKQKIEINSQLFSDNVIENINSYEIDKLNGFNMLFGIEEEISMLQFILEQEKDSQSTFKLNESEVFNNLVNEIPVLLNKNLKQIEYVPTARGSIERSFGKSSYIGRTIKKLQEILSNESLKDPIETKINKWLKYFEINGEFKISKLESGRFHLKLGEQSIADMGFGLNQLIPVIISSILVYYEGKTTIIIEEPESNLHPNLQSRLTNFFYEINKEDRTNFIIETHSEYIIRNTQLIALENDLLEDKIDINPFSVIYFDKINGPYTMNYTKEGRFDRDFGEGFYDVSSKILRTILKNSKTPK